MEEEKARAEWCSRNILSDHLLLLESLEIFRVIVGFGIK